MQDYTRLQHAVTYIQTDRATNYWLENMPEFEKEVPSWRKKYSTLNNFERELMINEKSFRPQVGVILKSCFNIFKCNQARVLSLIEAEPLHSFSEWKMFSAEIVVASRVGAGEWGKEQ